LKRYETILIADANLPDDEQNNLIARYSGIISSRKGILVKADNWGKRKLAYEIKKQNKGLYVLFEYAGESAIVNELERNLKIDDKILKFMTVLIAKNIDPVALEKELAEMQEKKGTTAQTSEHTGSSEPPAGAEISDQEKENA